MKYSLLVPKLISLLLLSTLPSTSFSAAPLSFKTDTTDPSFWSKLWFTPNQRAEHLLQEGKAKEAAHLFTDPHHRGYAQLQANEYAEAAKTLSSLDEAEAHYNRGNALAYQGQLQEALEAYQAALAKDPHHKDALHNRDIVKKALKSSPSSKENPSGQPQDNQSSSSDKSSSSKDNQKGNPHSPSDQTPSSDHNNETSPSKQEGSSSSPNNPKPSSRKSEKPSLLPPSKETTNSSSTGSPSTKNPLAPSSDQTPNEQQLSRDQWLQQIPDDPGGLLRRKFLIQYKLKQQEAQP